MSRFRLHYFLAEDAIEVIAVDKRSDDSAPKLLGKRKLLLPQYQHSVKTCAEIKFTASTPSTRRLLDGVAVPVRHRSTEPGRPRYRREMT